MTAVRQHTLQNWCVMWINSSVWSWVLNMGGMATKISWQREWEGCNSSVGKIFRVQERILDRTALIPFISQTKRPFDNKTIIDLRLYFSSKDKKSVFDFIKPQKLDFEIFVWQCFDICLRWILIDEFRKKILFLNSQIIHISSKMMVRTVSSAGDCF